MTQRQLNRSVASKTGEDLREIADEALASSIPGNIDSIPSRTIFPRK